MHNNAQSTIVITHVTEGFVHLALGAISCFKMNPAHGIGRVAKVLDHEDLRNTLHPGAPIGSRRTNCKARIAKGRIITNEIGDGTITCLAERSFAICPGWLEGHRTKLVLEVALLARLSYSPCQDPQRVSRV